MSIWNETFLKYTPVGIAINLSNGDGIFPDGPTRKQNNCQQDNYHYLFCPACKVYSAVDCGDRKRIYCTSCHEYSQLPNTKE
jgi:hypothetical protein